MKNIIQFLFYFILFSSVSQCKKKTEDTSDLFKKIDSIFEVYIDTNYIDKSILDIYGTTKVNCNSINKILNTVYINDQEVRATGVGDMDVTDSINRTKVIALLKKCNISLDKFSLNKESGLAIFLTLQHSGNPNLMAYYHKKIRKLVDNNILNKGSYAFYVDRFLGLNNQSQIFGTQIKNGKLFRIENPNKVNERREMMNMTSIEEYLMSFGIKY